MVVPLGVNEDIKELCDSLEGLSITYEQVEKAQQLFQTFNDLKRIPLLIVCDTSG